MTVIMRQIEETKQTEKAVKACPCFTQFDGRVGRGNEKVGEQSKGSYRGSCHDTVRGLVSVS